MVNTKKIPETTANGGLKKEGWKYSSSPQAEIEKKGGSRPQARTTGHKPQAVFHVKKKNKGGSRPHAPLCPRHFVH